MTAIVAVPCQECLQLRTLTETSADRKDSQDGLQKKLR